MSILDWYRRVQYTVGNREHPVIESLKKQAKTLHQQYPTTFTLMQAQDHLAQRNGFMHWHHAQQVAANYKQLYDAASKLQPVWEQSSAPVQCATQAQVRAVPARWLGLDELASRHIGQIDKHLRLNTLVVGSEIGPVYFDQWVKTHLEDNQCFLAWLNCSAWPRYSLPTPNTVDSFTMAVQPEPYVVRLGTSQLKSKLMQRVQPMEIQWRTLSEMHAWVNLMRPHLSQSASETQALTQLLSWLWAQTGKGYKTGSLLVAHLAPQALSHFPGWGDNQHQTLLLAGELAQMFRNAQPFNVDNKDNAIYLTVDQWLAHCPGTIILDDGDPVQEQFRLCVQAWLRSSMGHRLGVRIDQPPGHSYFPSNHRTQWYFSNTFLPLLPIEVTAQCRALGIGMTYFSNADTNDEAHIRLRANTLTKLVQSPESCQYALYFKGHDNPLATPLRIEGHGINASARSRSH